MVSFVYPIPSSFWFHTASRRQIVYLLHLIEHVAVPARERRYEEPSSARGGTEPRRQWKQGKRATPHAKIDSQDTRPMQVRSLRGLAYFVKLRAIQPTAES